MSGDGAAPVAVLSVVRVHSGLPHAPVAGVPVSARARVVPVRTPRVPMLNVLLQKIYVSLCVCVSEISLKISFSVAAGGWPGRGDMLSSGGRRKRRCHQ